MLRITGTFLDEISHDIPHQNWGATEWARDFAAMHAVGIDTVILIRCGHKRWLTYPSAVLQQAVNAFEPPEDLVRMFLDLAGRHGMRFLFGTYDSGVFWHRGEHERETDLSRRVIDEAWTRYGAHPAFAGWYLTQEVSRNVLGIVDILGSLGRHAKAISGGLPVLISPYIEGRKAVWSFDAAVTAPRGIGVDEHAREWETILAGLHGAVDQIAFQDGHVEFDELPEFLAANRELATRHGMESWTNTESFDRDMPIKFLPIKWEKLRRKLLAAEQAGITRAITFEFSHFLSPHACYPQAHGLHNRYREYLGLPPLDAANRP